jgi:membrane-associated protease RseP (regulator of RpoE activity)
MEDRTPLPIVGQTSDVPAVEAEALADYLRALVEGDMGIESVQLGRDQQREGVVIVRGRLLKPSEELFPRWMETLGKRGYTPLLRPQEGRSKDFVALHVIAGVAPEAHPRAWVNGLLFALTVLSTLFVGAQYAAANADIQSFGEIFLPQNFIKGWPFALTLLSILGAHEFGHYFAARFHRVAVTLPYFIPVPLPPFGTLGAVIQMKAPIPDRRKLFDIGVAGPLAGLVLAVPLLFLGLSTSPVNIPTDLSGYWVEGNSILYYTAKLIVFGQRLPNPVTGADVFMNQVTTAAWAGLLVTALNLLPLGQLDGGHTVFAMFGEKARYINRVTLGVMAFLAFASLGVVQQFIPWLSHVGFNGWFIWLLLILLLIGPYHPPALDDVTELDRRRRMVGWLVLAIFIITFVPVPMRVIM